MPVADYEIYCRMLERARDGHFAYPAINVTSLTTANAVLKGLAESKSDGIIQFSTGSIIQPSMRLLSVADPQKAIPPHRV